MPGPAYSTGQILISKNEDWQTSIQYTSTFPTTDFPGGQPINISNSAFRLQIRATEEQHTALVDVKTPDGIVINDGPNGIFTINIFNENSDRVPNSSILPVGNFVADLIRILSDGRVERLWEGTVVVNEGTTR
jgi:hypothetical protein